VTLGSRRALRPALERRLIQGDSDSDSDGQADFQIQVHTAAPIGHSTGADFVP
jgi:hypothetical protein